MRTLSPIVLSASIALMLTACGDPKDANKGNFSKAIQAYLDTQQGLCANFPAKEAPFTFRNKGAFEGDYKRRSDSLVDAGLLSSRDTEVKSHFGNTMEPATEYQLTDLGKKYLKTQESGNANAFCSGKYVLVDVTNFTEPSDMMGMKVARVNFRYKLDGLDDWVKTETLKAHFKGFEEQTKGDIDGQATLVLTNNGWIHERMFKP